MNLLSGDRLRGCRKKMIREPGCKRSYEKCGSEDSGDLKCFFQRTCAEEKENFAFMYHENSI